MRKLSVADYVDGVRAGDRTVLARAITLIESEHPKHTTLAQEVLTALLPFTGGAQRVGISEALQNFPILACGSFFSNY